MALPSRSCQLSITAEDLQGDGRGKKIIDQLQSPLFRLPLEIRLRIYEYALGGRVLLFQPKYDSDPTKPVSLWCRPCQHRGAAWNVSYNYDPCPSLLPLLLQSCRHM